ncbi:MAG: hypothetical protein H5T84_05495, partial [Thermoleophilia bacterium]|nr:hypothetical protein [Thermoleophilia bacterium]
MKGAGARRLSFKRAFTAYYLELYSPGIADPTAVFAACHEYLSALFADLGPQEFMRRLDEEVNELVGQLEQDLRRILRARGATDLNERFSAEVEERLRECIDYAIARLPLEAKRPSNT